MTTEVPAREIEAGGIDVIVERDTVTIRSKNNGRVALQVFLAEEPNILVVRALRDAEAKSAVDEMGEPVTHFVEKQKV